MAVNSEAKKVFESFIVVLIGVILAPVIYSLSISANVSGVVATVLALIPLLFVLGILWTQVSHMF